MSNQKLKVIEEFKEIIDAKMDRRYFLKCSAFLGGSLAASHFLVRYVEAAARGKRGLGRPGRGGCLHPISAGESDLLGLPAMQHPMRHQGQDRGRPGGQDRRQSLQPLDHDSPDRL